MDEFAKKWQKSIVNLCESKLDRSLSPIERKFIESRGAGIALEFIQDTVNALSGEELIEYLNSENNK